MRLSLRSTIREQLAQIGVRPEQITFVGLSHYHFDHSGQAAEFPGATLLIGARDWDAVHARQERAQPLLRWAQGGGSVFAAPGDHDVFGDSSVMMLATPGHTPGHRALLVRLQNRGAILLSGDVYHFEENVLNRGVPGFNWDRAETLASMDRFDRIAANLGATVILQHEPADVAKLPPFPERAD
jgi:glyoxylase-like metal-dependent hydrolase (beta-lactamase superfamily II)